MSAAKGENTDEGCMIKGEKIGSGTYGFVYKMTDANGKEEYAFKRNLNNEAVGNFSMVIRELDILNRLKGNPRVIAISMVAFGNPSQEVLSPIKDTRLRLRDDSIHFLFELGDTNLYDWMSRNMPSFSQIKQFMLDILLGLEFITLSGLLHRDMKSQNVVVFKPGKDPLVMENESRVSGCVTPDENGVFFRAKICDFGMAIPYVPGGLSRQVTTPYYRAPEVAAGRNDYGFKIDAWSTGCILYELLFRRTFVGDLVDSNDSINDLQSAIIRNLPYAISKHELNTIMNYRGSATQPDRIIPIRDRILANKSLVQLISREEPDVVKIARQLDDVISRLLIVDPAHRAGPTEILDLPFFDSHRSYINQHRQRYRPSKSEEHTYNIWNCLERTHVLENIVINIYNMNRKVTSRAPWYTHQRLFHAIDFFDRCLRYALRRAPANAVQTEFRGKAWDAEESELYFYNCLYISIKYFAVLEPVIDIRDLLPPKYRTEKIIEDMARRELFIVRSVFDYKIYRYTIFEALSVAVSTRGSEFEMIVHLALKKLFSDEINGMTPTKLAESVVGERIEQRRLGVQS